MTVRIPSLIAAAAFLALAPTAQASEPVTLDDDQLDEVIAGSSPGTGVDDIIWEIAGDETYDASASNSLAKLSSGSRIVKASDDGL